jgi:NitT/TauT family transport system ATP-binding protein
MLEIRGLTKVFYADPKEQRNELLVLDRIDLSVRRNQFVCLLGPSGCGKSTLLRILVGLTEADGGTVTVDGKEVKGPGEDRCMVFQNYGLLPWRNVRDNVEFGLEVRGGALDQRRAACQRSIEKVGLAGFERHYPHQISGGMQQRTGLARALSKDPKILLMDEPFAAVDMQTRERLQEELLRIWNTTETTVLFVTHSVEEAVYLGDRIVVMGANPGTVRQEIVNSLPHPREYRHPEFLRMTERIHDVVTGLHLPEEAPATGSSGHVETGPVRPVPNVSVGQILGLLEILGDRGGEEDLFRVDALTDYDFGRTIAVVKGAEMLGFVDTPGDLVRLTEAGREISAAQAQEKRVLFRRRLVRLGLFAAVVKHLAADPDRARTGEEVRELLAQKLPGQSVEDLFRAVVSWGRYGQLLDYDEPADEMTLYAGRDAADAA